MRSKLGNDFAIMTVSILQRNPIVMTPLSSIELEYTKYRQNLESEKSRGTFNIGNSVKGSTGVSVAAAEVSVSEIVELNEQAEPKDLARKLNRKLYFCVKDQELKGKWTLPMSRFNLESADSNISSSSGGSSSNHERALHTHAHEFLSNLLNPSENLNLYHLGPAPVAYYLEKYADRVVAPLGAKHFFFRSQLVSGKFRVVPKIQDFGWFCKEELKEKLDHELFEAIEPVISE